MLSENPYTFWGNAQITKDQRFHDTRLRDEPDASCIRVTCAAGVLSVDGFLTPNEPHPTTRVSPIYLALAKSPTLLLRLTPHGLRITQYTSRFTYPKIFNVELDLKTSGDVARTPTPIPPYYQKPLSTNTRPWHVRHLNYSCVPGLRHQYQLG